MKQTVILSIQGTQTYEDQEPEVISLVTEGSMEFRDGGWDISYEESELTGLKGVTTTFRVEPGTVKIVGFDDIQSRLSLSMPLTTIGAGKAAFGQALVDLLMKRISGDTSDFPTRQVLPTKLVVRKSTQGE